MKNVRSLTVSLVYRLPVPSVKNQERGNFPIFLLRGVKIKYSRIPLMNLLVLGCFPRRPSKLPIIWTKSHSLYSQLNTVVLRPIFGTLFCSPASVHRLLTKINLVWITSRCSANDPALLPSLFAEEQDQTKSPGRSHEMFPVPTGTLRDSGRHLPIVLVKVGY